MGDVFDDVLVEAEDFGVVLGETEEEDGTSIEFGADDVGDTFWVFGEIEGLEV